MSTRLYVGNLPWDATEDDIRALFESNSRLVTDVHVPTDKDTGKPRGFAFVEMGSAIEADEAINEFDGTDFQGRSLRVNEAKPKTNKTHERR